MDPLQRWVFQHGQHAKALRALQDAVDTDSGDKKSRDSILLSFVFTFETACKLLRSVLVAKGENPPDYAAAVLKASFAARLIADPDQWVELRECRNDVSHAYDEQRARAIAGVVKSFALAAFGRLLTEQSPDHG